MKRNIIADIITFFFTLLFLYTGIVKFTEIQTFKQELSSSPLIEPMAGFVMWALPITELLIVVALQVPKWRLKGMYASFALMSLFTIYVSAILLIDTHISCSCGGIIENLTPRQHILFNSACVILSGVGILVLRRQASTARFRWMTSTSAAGLLGLVGWLLFSAFTTPTVHKIGLEGRPLPNIDLLLPDSLTHFNTAEIPEGKPFIVIGFDPFCRHCQDETADILQHMNLLKDIHIYYITPADFKKARTFYRHYHLDKYPNIMLGQDSANAFFTYFKSTFTPFSTVYDAKKRLKAGLGGQSTAAQLAKLVAD